MKPIQVMFDTELLTKLDKDDEVRERGRSAVLRRVVREHLQKKSAQKTRLAYERAYGGSSKSVGKDDDFKGWEDEGVWPEE